jgi:hypothetical protein
MRKSLSRNIYLAAIGLAIVAGILLAISIPGGTSTQTATGTQVTPGNGALFGIALFLFFAAGIVGFVAWIGALIRMAQLKRWGWLICLIVFSGIAMLLYIFIGPTTALVPMSYQTTPSNPGTL